MTFRRTLPESNFTRRTFVGWFCAACLGASSAQAEAVAFRLIVHPGSPRRLERSFVADVFLKKRTRWPNDAMVRPVDLKPSSKVRRVFSENVLKRSLEAVRSYWQQRIFSGRDVPPPELESEEAVVRYVARNPGAIGYVSGEQKLEGVEVVTLA